MPCRTLRMKAESSTISTRVFFPASLLMELLHCSRRHICQRSLSRAYQARYRGYERFFLNRLGHEGNRAFFHGAIAMLGAGARGHHHDRNATQLFVLAKVREQLVTVGAWHLQVGDNAVAPGLGGDLQRFQSVG